MGSLQTVALRRRYSTSQNDLIAEFFVPCLEQADGYDRAVGYFSSTFYALIRLPLAEFVERRGKIRIVCSPYLSADDIEAIRDGYEQRALEGSLARDLDRLESDDVGRAAASLLGTLIAAGVIELKLAFNRNHRGLFHDKVGIFTDASMHQVSFTGSANETWAAWSGLMNHESFHAFASWTMEGAEHVKEDVESFERLWENHETTVEVVGFPEVARDRLVELADRDGIKAAQQELERQLTAGRLRPALRDHQQHAFDGWQAAGHRGIFEHATGSGKTITALNCVAAAVEQHRPVLVAVPSRTLLRQWRDEINAFFSGVPVLLAGDEHDGWKTGSVLRDSLTDVEPGGSIVLATMDTAASDPFVARVSGVPRLLLVADEVHRIGSPQRRRLLSVDADWRLGLSATWRREGDPEGTQAIQEFFGDVIEPPYTLADAIEDGHLCQYRYFVHPVALDEDERIAWQALSARIGQAIARAGGEITENVQHLLIQRARIIKSARGKIGLAADLITANYQPGEAWLVYCDNTAQLRRVREVLNRRGVLTLEFHTNAEGAADVDLYEFASSGGVMLSINCLDEGVDIPRISHAVILASSTTRRQFVQRRGRVLRQHSSKFRACIHDAIVDASGFADPESASFTQRELARALEFSESASDSAATRVEIQLLAAASGVDLLSQRAGDGSDELAEDQET
jgi:superfamily II DNA or RNA helicase/HKD family nuclease